MKTMSMEQIKDVIKVYSPITQNCIIKLYTRKLNELPIIAGTYKTRTRWWGIKIEHSLSRIKNLITAMATRRNLKEVDVDPRSFSDEDIAAYKTTPSTSFTSFRYPTLLWTPEACGIIRNLMGSIAMDLPKDSEQRNKIEEWLAFPPKTNTPIKWENPELDDRIHPGLAIKKAIEYWMLEGHQRKRVENTAIFALHALAGIRPGEEMSPDNFKLGELSIDDSSGRFKNKSHEYDLMIKTYHKQNRTPSFYKGKRAYYTVATPALQKLLEPWTVKRIKQDGANLSDPVFPNYCARNEEASYVRHKNALASYMGLYSYQGLRPYFGRKLFNRCLRLMLVSEMQAILKSMNRHAKITDDYVKCMAYTAMRQSRKFVVDFNWENYDTLIGPEVHYLCVAKALELALSYDPAHNQILEVASDSNPAPEMDFDGLNAEHTSIKDQLNNPKGPIDSKMRFDLMARKYEIESILSRHNRTIGN